MKTSEQTNELFTALAKAQSEMGVAKEDGFNKHLNAGYASLASLQEAYREPCSRNGLAIVQDVSSEGDSYFVETRVCHISGQWMSSVMKVMLEKQTMQSLGSAVTYAKRYSITSLLGIASEVDEEKVEVAAKKSYESKSTLNAAVSRGVELKEKLQANPPRPIMNAATNESWTGPEVTGQAIEQAKAGSKTGTVAVTRLVEAMKAPPKVSASIDLNSWDHMIGFGKFTGKTIREVGYKNAKDYLEFLQGQSGGKKLSPSAEALGKALSLITP